MREDALHAATLRLFNAVVIPKGSTSKKPSERLLKKTIPLGFIFSPKATELADDDAIALVSSLVGLSGAKANASFHKSWKTIEEASDSQLVLQQIIHYITTYGFEEAGIYDEGTIYIPPEQLKIPKVSDGIWLVVIDGLTFKAINEKVFQLASGIALKSETLDDLLTILTNQEWTEPRKIITKTQNRELRAKLYDHYDLAPTDPVEFLRFIVQRVTSESLLIKNDDLIEKIKAATVDQRKSLADALAKAPSNLAEIFLRYKPIFLALKHASSNKTFFNRLRKNADAQHKPMTPDFLNSVTAKLKNESTTRGLAKELEDASIFRKIRLAYALKFRTGDCRSIVYRVRNGKGYATSFNFDNQAGAARALKTVLASICDSLQHLKRKTIYIPAHVGYALPATEKMFTGNFPSGSYITVPQDMIVGVHWFDTDQGRVDLDLSTIGANGKTGWDADYRSEGKQVLFSGDLTAAPKPHGASELFYIKQGSADPKIMLVNHYNYVPDNPVEAKILVAMEKPSRGFHRYVVNPNNILAVAPFTVTRRQVALGLLVQIDGQQRFYFAQTSIGKSITSYGNEYIDQIREYYAHSMLNTISLADVFAQAGAKVVSEKPKGGYVDLSPEALERTTIINLLNGA